MVAGLRVGTIGYFQSKHIWSTRDVDDRNVSLIIREDDAAWSGRRFGLDGYAMPVLASPAAAIADGELATLGAEWGNGRALYKNGLLLISDSDTTKVGATSTVPTLGNQTNGYGGLDSDLAFWFGFAKKIGPRWHASLAANPWQIFAPIERRIWVPASANYFYYILQSADKPDPSAQQVATGLDGSDSAAIAAGNVSGPESGSATLYGATVTGLTQGTSYEEFWCYYDGTTYSPVAKFTFETAVSVQLLRPTSDIAAGAWTPSTGSTLYETLDETPYSDTDYILTASASTAEVKFGTGETPEAGDFIVRYRAKNNGSGALTVYLYQGATLKATHNPTLTSSYQTFTWTLSGGEAASITDFTDLRIKFTSS